MPVNATTGQSDIGDPLARALLKQAMENQPMYHWLHPLGKMAQFAAGSWIDREQRNDEAGEIAKALSGTLDLYTQKPGAPGAAATPGPLSPPLTGTAATPSTTTPLGSPTRDIAAAHQPGKPSAPAIPKPNTAIVLEAAQRVGVDPAYLTRLTGHESGGDPNIKSDTGAAGLGQFLPGTWKTYIAKYGHLYGYGPETPATDAKANALMTAHYTKDSMAAFRQQQGREAAPGELYAMHFLGQEGAGKLFAALKTNPNATTAQLYPELMQGPRLPDGRPNPRYSPTNIAALTANGQPLTAGALMQRLQGIVGGPQLAQATPGAPSAAPASDTPRPGAPTQLTGPQVAQAPPSVTSTISPAMEAHIRTLIASKHPRVKQMGYDLLTKHAKPQEYEFKSAGEQAYRWNPRTGTAEPILEVPKAPPAGHRWSADRTKLETIEGGPAHDSSKLRKEIQDLPSYKNIAQAAPVYKSMRDAAGRDNRAADVNLIYGLAKIMDPASVVRESEMTIAQAVATLPESLRARIQSTFTATGRLPPEVREAIMGEAYSRMSAYRSMFDQDTGMYRGIAERQRFDTRDIIPSFEAFEPYRRPATAVGAPAPADAGTLPGGIKYRVKTR